jgi:hypothetical protein
MNFWTNYGREKILLELSFDELDQLVQATEKGVAVDDIGATLEKIYAAVVQRPNDPAMRRDL